MKSKILNTRKKTIGKKKRKLINRINQCKTLEELKGFERTLSFYDVLQHDQDWDFDFFLDLIEFKLKRMANYFHTHRIVENEDWYGTLCDKAIDILYSGYKTNIILDSDLGDIYVNTRNIRRFFNNEKIIRMNEHHLNKYYLVEVREAKAKALFWKFLHHYIELLWD